MTDLKRAIQAIEHGLLAVPRKGRPTRKKELCERMAHYKVPGFSVALIEQGELAWAGGYGVMEAGGRKMVTPETIFQAASISKPVSAMVALHLVEAGLLDLDAIVNEALRSWKVSKSKHTQVRSDGVCPKVTLRGLLSHTAGMTVRGYLGYHSDAQLPTLQQILNGKPPAHSKPVRVGQAPGTGFRYSGGGYVVVQQWSTPSDLARLIVEVNKSYKNESNLVLSAEMTRQMLTAQMSLGGLGFLIIKKGGRTRFEHPGWNEGFHSLMIGDPVTGQGLAWMTNGENGRHLGWEVTRGLAEILGWSW